jgi:hypothetical protein
MKARSLETSESDLQLTRRRVPERRTPHLFPVLLIKQTQYLLFANLTILGDLYKLHTSSLYKTHSNKYLSLLNANIFLVLCFQKGIILEIHERSVKNNRLITLQA